MYSCEPVRLLLLSLTVMMCTAGLAPSAQAQQNSDTPMHLRPEAAAARKALISVTMDSDPKVVYDNFNTFCRTHFGIATEPMVYEKLGQDLKFLEGGEWRHVSENSASLAWETNLPAESYVEYGPTTTYGQQTEKTDRLYFLHLHQLKGLPVNQTFHYRLVAVDEKGRKITSPDQIFKTAKIAGAVYLPGDMKELPYKLEKGSTTYILTQDITTPAGALVTLRDDIVIDLNGHTITYGTQTQETKDIHGITGRGSTKGSRLEYQASNLKIFNGTILQGNGPGVESNKTSGNYAPMAMTGRDFEVAGVRLIYHCPQAWGMSISHAQGDIQLHHNTFKDMGAKVTNRHGSANRTVGFQFVKEQPNAFAIHHNLVQRARQNALSKAHNMYNNEVYIDSWSTNSFAIQPDSAPGIDAGEHHHNRIFATGFNAYGFGWAHENLKIHNNFVYMFGLDVSSRWTERWGDVNMLSAMRLTNYGKGGQVRNNIQYYDNLILMRAMENAEIRGVEFFSDETIKDLVFHDNALKVESLDDQTLRVSAINAQGHFRKENTLPVYYRDNLIISNVTNVTFGDSYGKGNNHHFENNRFVKLGNHEGYHTFRFSGAFYNKDHVVLDGVFENGAAPDDVYWERTALGSYYTIAWTLDLESAANAKVSVKDATGKVVFTGQTDANGKVAIPLEQAVIHPFGWTPSKNNGAAMVKEKHVADARTPHEITVMIDGRNVTRKVNMNKKTTLTMR